MSGCSNSRAVRLFDAHCHLQDRRIAAVCPKLIRASIDSGVLRFAVNGVSEKDWHLVKQMGEQYPCVVPNFGLHPCCRTSDLNFCLHLSLIQPRYVNERTANWFNMLREFLTATPTAAVGEIGLDKGSHGRNIDFSQQVEVFRQQLDLAKELQRPASVHCVRAFGDLLEILQNAGPFPAGLILHSYLGSAEMVSGFAKLGAYFSFSGYLTSMKSTKAKNMLKLVPKDRILVESDAPDGLPNLKTGSLLAVPADDSSPQGLQSQQGDPFYEASASPKEELNHPANIHTVLHYVATMLQMPDEELAELTYRNATRLFSYNGSKVVEVD